MDSLPCPQGKDGLEKQPTLLKPRSQVANLHHGTNILCHNRDCSARNPILLNTAGVSLPLIDHGQKTLATNC